MKNRFLPYALVVLVLLAACSEDYSPKPKAYFKIDLPEKSYRDFHPDNCPFEFEVPEYTTIERDSMYFDRKLDNPCMINLHFNELGATLHLSYHEINEQVDIKELYKNTHKFTYHHTDKADYIEEIPVKNEHQVEMLLNRVGGDAASALQFYATDREQHFLNGSLYFNVAPNADSLAPVISFVEKDMLHMLQTFNWK